MVLGRNVAIEIRQLANGYIVLPCRHFEDRMASGDNERFVFQTFEELLAYIKAHFSHRAVRVLLDNEE